MEYEKANEIMDRWIDFLVRHIVLEVPEKLRATTRDELLEAYNKIRNG